MNTAPKTPTRVVPVWTALIALSVLLPACASTARDTTTTEESAFSDDVAGSEPLEGVVRIASIDRSGLETDGTVKYVLDNVSGQDHENLSARVIFYYPPSSTGGIQLDVETDVTAEQSVILFAGQTGFEVAAKSAQFDEKKAAGQGILATKIDVQKEELIPFLERTSAAPGSRFFNNQLECVTISPEDHRLGIDGSEPVMWFDVENISRASVSNVEIKVLFLDRMAREKHAESDWIPVPTLSPGQKERVNVDLSAIPNASLRDIILRVRQTLDIFG